MFRKHYKLVINVAVPTNTPNEQIYIVGNHKEMGNWKVDKVALIKQPDNTWQGVFFIRKNKPLAFKITRGSWETEAVNSAGISLPDHHLKIKDNTTHSIEVNAWKDQYSKTNKTTNESPEKRITGNVFFHHSPAEKGLKARDLLVWLPPSYSKKPDKRYPVLYMHDGQNLFDPQTAFTGVDWQADETATRLIKNDEMQEIIIVGIYNTVDRMSEYADCEKGRLYRNFITKELKPFIDKTYRTLPSRENTATIGSSMGGLVSFLLIWYHADVFGMAGCMSPSFILNKDQILKKIRSEDLPNQPIKIMMDCGGIGGEKLLKKGCKKMIRILKRKGMPLSLNFQYHYYSKANHSEQAWSERLFHHFLFMFSKS